MQELIKCYIWKQSLELCWNLGSSEGRTEITEKFWNVLVDKAAEDQLDGSCEIWRRTYYIQSTSISSHWFYGMSYLNIYDWYLDYDKRVSTHFLFPCSLIITSRNSCCCYHWWRW
jgi:hypothetical protein